ncbi:MAG: XcyI family restriction endonuclease, partial [Planctomycetes bacterium]|nr:XcyI family restriction endonuclease [Planctomycetota bacterium]
VLRIRCAHPWLHHPFKPGRGANLTRQPQERNTEHAPYALRMRWGCSNAAGRAVHIEFASDPDIKITEELRSSLRPLVSIEIKGGEDRSNIHNRLGEAEKSHQKALEHGYREFWTILGAKVNPATAKLESPTTKHFFQLKQILHSEGDEHRDFQELVCSILGIRYRKTKSTRA